MFACKTCTFQSISYNDLVYHSLRHMTLKPFKCIFCDFSATRYGDMVMHIHEHANPTNKSKMTSMHIHEVEQSKFKATAHLDKTDTSDDGSRTLPYSRLIHSAWKKRRGTSLRRMMVFKRKQRWATENTDHLFKSFRCQFCDRFILGQENWQRHRQRHLQKWPEINY